MLQNLINYVIPPSRTYDPVIESERAEEESVSLQIDYYNNDEEDEEGGDGDEEEEDMVYSSNEEANTALLKSYWTFMSNHYGRTPCYRTDLYCSMLCIDVSVRGEMMRFWWLVEGHPLVVVLLEYFKENGLHPAIDIFSCPGFGLLYVYENKTMDFCVDQLMDMYRNQGYHIEHVVSQYAQQQIASIGPQCVINVEQEQEPEPEQEQQNVVVVDEAEPEVIIKPTLSSVMGRPENSKKAD